MRTFSSGDEGAVGVEEAALVEARAVDVVASLVVGVVELVLDNLPTLLAVGQTPTGDAVPFASRAGIVEEISLGLLLRPSDCICSEIWRVRRRPCW